MEVTELFLCESGACLILILPEALTTNPVHSMKTYSFITFLIAAALTITPQLLAKRSPSHSRSAQSLFTEEEEEKEDAGPPDSVIKKLAAMSPEQKFERGEPTKSDGKVAPKDTTVYPVQIKNAEGQTVLRAYFFKGENGKWSIFDESGNVMHET